MAEARGTLTGTSWRGDTAKEEEAIQTSGDRTFVSLHNHTTFSFLDGFGLPSDHAQQAARVGMHSLAITDHGNVSGFVQHRDACRERGIKPIFGCEIYAGGVGEQKTAKKNHLTVLAKNVTGYKNLNCIVTEAWKDGFYYWPTVSGRSLADRSEGLVVLSGCTASLLATSLVGGKNIKPEDASYDRAKAVATKFKALFGPDYYLEVQVLPELEETRAINTAYEKLGRELGIQLVATGDLHVPCQEDSHMRQILHACRPGKNMTVDSVGQEFDYSVPTHLFETDQEIVDRLIQSGMSEAASFTALENTSLIANMCNVELPSMPMVRYPLDNLAVSSVDLFMQWLRNGWLDRGVNKFPKAERERYRKQLLYEVDIIKQKDYCDYFLIVSDMVKYAKGSGIAVGPGRGSVAASLVAWLLHITEVNPMLFDHLVFERFIDITRQDLPDIDLDFDSRRSEVRQYLSDKYGDDKVGNLITFVRYKGKNSMDDVARVYQVPKWEVEKVKDLMIERSGGDLRSSATIEDTVEYFDAAKEVFDKYPELWYATKLEGNIKGMGVHAAGVVVASEPITNVCATYTRTVAGHEIQVVAFDKYDAEKIGLLKLDNLGLNTMDLLNFCRKFVGMSLDEMYAIPLDDAVTLQGFQGNDVTGIFQFDGWAMQLVNSILCPESFLEVCDVGALARPGPLHNGSVDEYVEVKTGKKAPRRYHPLVDEITKHTNYQIVYQEQILRIVMEVGNFDWTHAAYIRKIISRRMGEQEFNRQGERFMAGAKANGLSESDAKEVWGACITAGSYAFNSAHAVSYGLLAWWTMYFKQHHPAVFFSAALQHLTEQKQERLLQDATKHGIEVLPPDPILSQISWMPEGNNIRAGLSQVSGIGKKSGAALLDWRSNHKVSDWTDYKAVKGIGAKTIERIKNFAALEDPFNIYSLTKKLTALREDIDSGKLALPVPTYKAIDIPYHSEVNVDVIWTGEIFHRNLRDLFEVNMSRTGVPLDPKQVKDAHLREWIIMYGKDETDHVYIVVDRWKYPRFRKVLWEMRLNHDLIVLSGVKRKNRGNRCVHVNDLWVIDPD